MIYDLAAFGKTVQRARLSRRNSRGKPWSEYDLADHVGVRASSINRIEAGKVQPRQSTLRRLVEVLPEIAAVGVDYGNNVAEMIAWLPRANPDALALVMEAYRRARELEREGDCGHSSLAKDGRSVVHKVTVTGGKRDTAPGADRARGAGADEQDDRAPGRRSTK